MEATARCVGHFFNGFILSNAKSQGLVHWLDVHERVEYGNLMQVMVQNAGRQNTRRLSVYFMR